MLRMTRQRKGFQIVLESGLDPELRLRLICNWIHEIHPLR